MRIAKSKVLRFTAAVFAVFIAFSPAEATSYIMPTDRELVAGSVAVVEARVLTRDHASTAALLSTDYSLAVEEVLSGSVNGPSLVVRVPGGERPDGVGLYLAGMPELVVGERVLLFLSRRGDGTYGIHNLMLGAFHEVGRGGQRVFIRGLEGAREMVVPGLPNREPYYRLRSAEPFRRWLRATARGALRQTDYFIEPAAGLGRDGAVGTVTGQFRLFTDGRNGLPIRWFDFDSRRSIEWRTEPGGQPGFSSRETESAFQAGMAAWNSDRSSIVDYRYVGTTPSTLGFNSLDGINALIYRNADGSIGSGDFRCSGGGASGTLALGGPFYCRPGTSITPPPYNGLACPAGAGARYNAAFEAEVITNRGIECLFDLLRGQPNGDLLAQRALEALLGHELGHTLGIGHSCTDAQVDAGTCPTLQGEALMYPFLHIDGRGALLNDDDLGAVRALYRGDGRPRTPEPPSDLVGVLTNGNDVTLSWRDNSDDETAFVVEVERLSFNANFITVPANTETLALASLRAESIYRFRVRARNTRGNSAASNQIELRTELGLPTAPAGLVATIASATSVALVWEDRSDNETDFVVESLSGQSGDWLVTQTDLVADAADGTVDTTVEGLTTGVPYSFRVRARNSQGLSEPSNVATVTPANICVEDSQTLCLLNDRFQVTVEWRDQRGESLERSPATANELSERSGTFWFFREDNIELIVKVLDGTSINRFYWTFYGALTDVEYWITVADVEGGGSRTYHNPPGETCGQFDTTSLPGDLPTDPLPLQAVPLPASPLVNDAATAGSCVSSATTLCLLDDRFAVEVDWENPYDGGATGRGIAVPEAKSERTGYFWFFNAANIELVVKALDGRPVNGHYWFFYGALSDIEYQIVVTDTLDGRIKIYTNPAFNPCGQFDNSAFLPSANE